MTPAFRAAAVLLLLALAALAFALGSTRSSSDDAPIAGGTPPQTLVFSDRSRPTTDATAATGMLLASTDTRPTLTLAWQTNSGWRSVSDDFDYTAPNVRTDFAPNLDAYVGLGGTRLDKGAGDPAGLIVRVGFYKLDPGQLLLPDVAPGGKLKLTLSGVRFNQAVDAAPRSILAHLKYGAAALESCGAPRELADVYLTANPADDLSSKLIDERGARLGFLLPTAFPLSRPNTLTAPTPPERTHGRASARLLPDGSLTIEALLPYSAFRHTLGVYQPPEPGRFAEPDHFHIEVEVVPTAAPDA